MNTTRLLSTIELKREAYQSFISISQNKCNLTRIAKWCDKSERVINHLVKRINTK